jgi:hypothetical protein
MNAERLERRAKEYFDDMVSRPLHVSRQPIILRACVPHVHRNARTKEEEMIYGRRVRAVLRLRNGETLVKLDRVWIVMTNMIQQRWTSLAMARAHRDALEHHYAMYLLEHK